MYIILFFVFLVPRTCWFMEHKILGVRSIRKELQEKNSTDGDSMQTTEATLADSAEEFIEREAWGLEKRPEGQSFQKQCPRPATGLLWRDNCPIFPTQAPPPRLILLAPLHHESHLAATATSEHQVPLLPNHQQLWCHGSLPPQVSRLWIGICWGCRWLTGRAGCVLAPVLGEPGIGLLLRERGSQGGPFPKQKRSG